MKSSLDFAEALIELNALDFRRSWLSVWFISHSQHCQLARARVHRERQKWNSKRHAQVAKYVVHVRREMPDCKISCIHTRRAHSFHCLFCFVRINKMYECGLRMWLYETRRSAARCAIETNANPPDRRHQTVKLILTVSLSIQNNLIHVCLCMQIIIIIYTHLHCEATFELRILWCGMLRSCAKVFVCVFFGRLRFDDCTRNHKTFTYCILLSLATCHSLSPVCTRASVCASLAVEREENLVFRSRKNWKRTAQCRA